MTSRSRLLAASVVLGLATGPAATAEGVDRVLDLFGTVCLGHLPGFEGAAAAAEAERLAVSPPGTADWAFVGESGRHPSGLPGLSVIAAPETSDAGPVRLCAAGDVVDSPDGGLPGLPDRLPEMMGTVADGPAVPAERRQGSWFEGVAFAVRTPAACHVFLWIGGALPPRGGGAPVPQAILSVSAGAPAADCEEAVSWPI